MDILLLSTPKYTIQVAGSRHDHIAPLPHKSQQAEDPNWPFVVVVAQHAQTMLLRPSVFEC